DGVGEIAESGLLGPSVGATLHGQVSLPERRLDAKGDLVLRPPADASRGILTAWARSPNRGSWGRASGRPCTVRSRCRSGGSMP
ncbi:hypothetical protein CTI14_67305, partial [Methylobacterium radiotolerans]